MLAPDPMSSPDGRLGLQPEEKESDEPLHHGTPDC